MTETGSRLGRTSASTGTSSRVQYRGGRAAALVDLVIDGMRLWRRAGIAAAIAGRWLGSTVTPAGWLVLGATAIGLALGLSFGWAELVIAGVVAAVLLLLAVPFLLGARAYRAELALAHDRVVAGADVDGEIVVVNRGRRTALPARLEIPVGAGLVEVHLPLLRPGAQHRETVTVPARRRGVVTVGPATMVRGDPLGILRRELSWSQASTLFVHPVTTAIPNTSAGFIRDLEGDASALVVDSDMSFHAIREYAPGDAPRQVHWKSTAKTGTLMVRQYEESRRSRMLAVLALGADDYADEEEFELAVSVVGSIGSRAILDGRAVDIIVGAEVPELVRRSVRAVRELRAATRRTLLDDLAGIELSSSVAPLTDACAMAAQTHAEMSIVFVVCGSTVSMRTLRAAALAFPVNVSVVGVVCDPRAQPSFRGLGEVAVMTVGLLDDLRLLMLEASRR